MEIPPKRLHRKNFIPASVCKELQFIHKSCNVAGYRPFVLSTTLLHLIATNCSPLIMPFLSIREAIKDLVEELFGCEFELFVEFTGLISWSKGAKIGWHSDSGRAYLKQRHFTAVCYLNSHIVDFHGGLFHFQEGRTTIVPERGDVLIFRAEEVHCVDEVLQGERCTLALWFTKENSCDEDAKILNSIRLSSLKLPLHFHSTLSEEPSESMWTPLPASSTMYAVNLKSKKELTTSDENRTLQSDLRIARLASLGFEFSNASKESFGSLQEVEGCCDKNFAQVQDALEQPIMLKLDKEVLPYVFANSIHALQVLYFCKWKTTDERDSPTRSRTMQGECVVNQQRSLFLHLQEWEHYMTTNFNELQRCFPVWYQFKRVSPTVP